MKARSLTRPNMLQAYECTRDDSFFRLKIY